MYVYRVFSFMSIDVNFIVGQLSEQELQSLKEGFEIVSKMFLLPDDFQLFRYRAGDRIQAESIHGNRLWCTIHDLEILHGHDRVIVIFNLLLAPERIDDPALR